MLEESLRSSEARTKASTYAKATNVDTLECVKLVGTRGSPATDDKKVQEQRTIPEEGLVQKRDDHFPRLSQRLHSETN